MLPLPTNRSMSMTRFLAVTLLAAGLAAPIPASAQAGGLVVCDAKVMRIMRALKEKGDTLTPQEQETARRALFKAISECRPWRSSHPGRAEAPPDGGGEQRQRVMQGAQQDRQSLRLQQDVLTDAEMREGDRRIDAIERKAQTDPYAAREMQKIWELDQSRATVNRPIPGGPDTPSLVGPGER